MAMTNVDMLARRDIIGRSILNEEGPANVWSGEKEMRSMNVKTSALLVAAALLLSSAAEAESKKVWTFKPDKGFVDDPMAFDAKDAHFAYVHTDMASPHLARYGSAAQKAKYLPAICRGEIITAVAVTEPGAGSDVAGLATRAVRDGDDYVLNGAKMFITNGVHGDLFFVAARTDPDVKGSRGISIFIVEKNTPGFSVSRQLDKHGWRCSDTAELVFEDCRVPAENLLGEENRGFYAIMDNFQNERLVLSGMAIGEASKALEITLDYLKERTAFDAKLWDKQGIRQRLAMLAAQVEAARQLAYHVAWLDESGEDCVAEVSMLKAMSAEVANRTLYDCVQFHGGMGYMRESTIERMSRDARLLPIGGGATEVMLEEVAKRL